MMNNNSQLSQQSNLQQSTNLQQSDIPGDNQTKKLRKLAERKPLPTNKDELIRHLVERLEQAEIAINDAQNILIEEKLKKEDLVKELKSKTDQLNTLLQQEKKTIQEKVQAELKSTLEIAVQGKVDAENEKQKLESYEYEKQTMIDELDYQVLKLRKEFQQLEIDFNQIQAENNQQKSQISQFKNEKLVLEEQLKRKTQENKEISQELAELKSVMEKLGDVRNVLNRMQNQGVVNLGNLNNNLPQQQTPVTKNRPDYTYNQVGKQNQPGNMINKQLPQKIQIDKQDLYGNNDNFWYGQQDITAANNQQQQIQSFGSKQGKLQDQNY